MLNHKKKSFYLIFLLLLLGFVYKILVTSNGNFIFNIDNARDLVDVREIVILHKLRLTGPTSGIEGFYNGPAWYYLLAIPFILTGGNPYSEVVLMILLWAIGGIYLFKLTQKYGLVVSLLTTSIWISSNYIGLATVYSFNPNPVVLLTPLFVYLLAKYLESNNLFYSVAAWFLGGLFFNFEMAFGIFLPLIIFVAIVASGRKKLFARKEVWLGALAFFITLLPQIIFNFRHGSLLYNSVIGHLNNSTGANSNILTGRISNIYSLYFSTISAGLMNLTVLTSAALIGLVLFFFIYLRDHNYRKDPVIAIAFSLIFVPFFGSLILPLNFLPWHLGGVVAGIVIFIGILVSYLEKYGDLTKLFAFLVSFLIIIYSFINLNIKSSLFDKKENLDPSLLNNETKAIDFIYKSSEGKNFRAYVFLPSVIDYPYQYLFWWYGTKQYGYIPLDYAYLPNKPQYISNKDKFTEKRNLSDSGLTYLIEEPSRPDLRDLWRNYFASLPILSKTKVGPLDVEIRKNR